MYYYFILQQRILSRKMEELGLNPVLGYILGVLVFLGLSFYLFYKTTYAGYIYAATGLSLVLSFGEKERNDFLKTTFPLAIYRQVRAAENGLLVLPFVVFLCCKTDFLLAFGLLLAALALSLFNSGSRLNMSIPTPFFRFPFEFTTGFRKYWLLYLIAYFVAWKAIEVANFNLGAGSLAFVCLLAMSHYALPENDYYVWMYNCTPLKAAQKTILISSHIFSTLNDTCDQIYVLRGGEIAQKVEKQDFQQLDEEMRQFVLGDKIESFQF